ncbi:MAG: glucokinase [Paracoccaceae bacterium]
MTNHPADQLNLVADIGGTNTRVALAKGSSLLPDTLAKYSNREFTDLGTVLRLYLKQQGNVECAGACVAVAGPVANGVGRLTNLNWSIDCPVLADATKAESVAILNDLQAQGYGLSGLQPDALTQVLTGAPHQPDAARLVVGLGTGFNAAIVYDTGDQVLVPPSEAGHIDLPVQTSEDQEFSEFVRKNHGFCAIDDVLTGRGIEQLYRWHGQTAGIPADKSAALIMAALRDGSDPTAKKSMRHFIHLAGVAIGNLALTHLPFGGLYLAGGVSRSVAPYFQQLGFEQAFRQKGRFTEYMQQFTVSVIEDDAAALAGCAVYLNRKI